MARLRARGPYWEIAWVGPDINPETGKKARHSKLLGRRDAVPEKLAKDALRELQRTLFIQEHSLGTPSSPSVGAWAEEYLTWHSAQWPAAHYRTEQVMRQHILPGWDVRPLDSISDREVEAKVTAWRQANYRDHTITKHLRILKAFFTRAVDKKLLKESPAAMVEPPQILDSAPHLFYEQEDLEALYLASSFDPHHKVSLHAPWHAPAWKLYANVGLRRGEGIILRKKWIKGGEIHILSTAEDRTKSGKWRAVPLFPGAVEALDALDEVLGEDREYVLPQLTLAYVSRAASKCIAKADLPGTLHTLRHTFISHLAMNPAVPVRTIQQWAGHASITTTEKYMYLRAGPPPVMLAL